MLDTITDKLEEQINFSYSCLDRVVFRGYLRNLFVEGSVINEFGCHVAKSYFESKDENRRDIEIEGKRYNLKGKSNKKIATSLGNITISRNYYQHRSGGRSYIPLDYQLGVREDQQFRVKT